MSQFPVFFTDLEPGEAPSAFRRQRDTKLKGWLKEGKPAVLKWLVQRAVVWYASRDLKRSAPEKVMEFSKQYFEEQDRLVSFLREHCAFEKDAWIHTAEMLNAYNSWVVRDATAGKRGLSTMTARILVRLCWFGFAVSWTLIGRGDRD